MKRWPLVLSSLVLSLVLMITVIGCGVRKVPSGANYYTEAQQYYSAGDYTMAVYYYQRLIDQYPYNPYEEDAELKIGLAYYKEGKYAEAIASLSDFERMHPTSKNLTLAVYYLAMSHFAQIGRPDQDQTNTEAALAKFQLIQQEFPESGYAELAREKAESCREMLARHELFIGDFYYNRSNFRAAESRMAELVEKYPETPVAPYALYLLGNTLKKEGKKYSAAQAYSATSIHYPKSPYAKEAKGQLSELHEPLDNESDPLKMVLAESGYGGNNRGQNGSLEDGAGGTAMGADSGYGPDGLPILTKTTSKTPGAAAHSGPVTLKTIRLASSDPPLSVIFDLSGPVSFNKEFQSGHGYATLRVHMTDTTPVPGMHQHQVFDRSIFKDCEVSHDASGTTVTINTTPVSRYAIVPLDEPSRLLITFTPVNSSLGQTAAANF